MINHHPSKCDKSQFWDSGEMVPCTCPEGWPQQERASSAELFKTVQALYAKVAMLSEALAFYAEYTNWRERDQDGILTRIGADYGETAREALGLL